MTADILFSRIRAAQALNEDFDSIVSEFGRGCPCKNPPLKSTGKTHLKATTHDKAFNKPDGKFFGMSVRAAFASALVVQVVHVQDGQPIAAVEAGEEEIDAEQRPELEDFEQMDASLEAEALGSADMDGDEDLSELANE